MGLWRIPCPHCKSTSTLREHRKESDLVDEFTVQCDNPYCAFSWIAKNEAVRTIRQSMTPNPDVNLPLSPRGMNIVTANGEDP